VAVVVGAYVGCGPRAQVAGQKILKKIDSILGELDVQLKKVEIKKAELTTQTDKVKRSLYETEARLEQMQEDQDVRANDASTLKQQLAKRVELLNQAKGSDSGEVAIGDKTYTKSELMASATAKAKSLKQIQARIASKSKLIDVYKNNLALYKNQVAISKTNLDKLSEQIDEIKLKKEALDDQRRVSLLDGKSISINDEFETLAKDVDDLLVTVDANLKLENDKLNERIADAASKSGVESELDELLDEKNDDAEAMAEFEALLDGDSN
jgi:chromosome segregation ATPase